MSAEVVLNTPLAEALSAAIQPKLVEVGWGSGGDEDSALAEYIVLMLVNGKSQDEIASELASDLLSLEPDNPVTKDFAKWLFEQIALFNARNSGGGEAAPSAGDQDEDMQMSADSAANELAAPTGPKAMRNGNNRAGGARERRMVGQMNRAMDRTHEPVLHRTRGNDRINSNGRTPPGGPRGGLPGRPTRGGPMNMNTRAASIAHGMATAMGGALPPNPMAMNNGAMNNGAMPGMNNGWMGPGGPRQDPNQPMDLYHMFQQQNQMMQHLQQQLNQTMMMNGGNNFQQPTGKPLSQRIQHPRQNNGAHNNNGNGRFRGGHSYQQNGPHQRSTDAAGPGAGGEGAAAEGGSEDVDMAQQPQQKSDPKETVCRFNLACTNRECKFAHQSPAAAPGTTVDVTDTCTFGAACKNHKCVGSHPSPATRAAHQSEQECKFWPNCSNPHCTFKHPSAPPCRNGADCSVTGCTFTHSKTMCKFRPCKNRYCQFKHEEGQRGTFHDKVWTANGGDHVSERKYADDSAPSEDIFPIGDDAADKLIADAVTEGDVIA